MPNEKSNKIQKCEPLLPLALMLFATTAPAADVAVGPTLGTRGVGLDVTYSIKENLNLRGTLAGLQYGRDINEGGIKYRGDMDLSSAGIILDWYPSTSSLRLSLGALYNGNRLNARAKAAEDSSIDIGDNTYDLTGESLRGTIKWDDAAPFIGIGWGSTTSKAGWDFAFELGAIYTGKPSASLEASPGLRAQPGFDADLVKEERELNRAVKDATFWPVVQMQVQYRF